MSLEEIFGTIGPFETPYGGKNGHFLISLFVAVALGVLRPLAPLASGQYPLLRIFFIHAGTIEGADAKSFAGTIFLMYGLGLNSASTYCVRLKPFEFCHVFH